MAPPQVWNTSSTNGYTLRLHRTNIYFVKARKLVVVSAGEMGSPLILERSGIGSKDVLEKALTDAHGPPDDLLLAITLRVEHFYSGYLSDPALELQEGHELLRQLPAFRGAFVPAHPQFPADSVAGAALAETGPVPFDAPKLVYSAEDDKAIDENLRQFVTTAWH
ncbi:hypothetical protein B0H14DRAFT_3431964 [Mycena olivaceomarginata]|nr:hypothetical protein B0H14DRAFT_3431964 [Mycena olivaceomarginata]